MDIYEFLIPDETITSAVSNACEFFGLPEVPIVNSEGVCVEQFVKIGDFAKCLQVFK